MFKVIHQNGKFYAVYDKEAYEKSVREELYEQGVEEGSEKTKIQFAKILKKKNFNIEDIMEMTKLSLDDLELYGIK